MFSKDKTEHYAQLCKNLGYHFKNKTLLIRALTRKSAINEGKQKPEIGTFQRHEFLGDSVIGLAISQILFTLHPKWDEGSLTTMRSHYVNNNAPLAKIAIKLGLDEFLIMGYGEKMNRINLNYKVLSDATEALFGAVFQDSGFNYNTIVELVKKHWAPLGLLKTNEKLLTTDSQNVRIQDDSDYDLVKAVEDSNAKKVVEHLLKGGNPNLTTTDRTSGDLDGDDTIHKRTRPLLSIAIAYAENAVPIVEALLARGADPNSQNSYYLHCMNPLPRIVSVTTLLKFTKNEDGSIKTEQKYKPINKTIYTKETVFHTLVEHAQEYSRKDVLEIATLLTKYKANPLLRNSRGKTPLEMLTEDHAYKKAKANPKLVLSDEEYKKATNISEKTSIDDMLKNMNTPNYGPLVALEHYFKSLPEYQPKEKYTPQGFKNILSNSVHGTLSVALSGYDDDYISGISNDLMRFL